MSRTLAAMIALMLGLPVLGFVAAGAAAGINPSVYSGAIGFLIGMCFIGAALLEIHRLATTPTEDLLYGWMPKQVSAPRAGVVPTAVEPVEHTRVEVIREPKAGAGARRVRKAA